MTYTIDDDVVTDHAPYGVQWITGNVVPEPIADLADSVPTSPEQTHRTTFCAFEGRADETPPTRPSRADAVAVLDATAPADDEDWRAYALVPAQVNGDGGDIRDRGDAWSDLLCALALVAGRPGTNPDSPFHCEHDTLTLNAHPRDFTRHELAQLAAWGFHASTPDEGGGLWSHRYGRAEYGEAPEGAFPVIELGPVN